MIPVLTTEQMQAVDRAAPEPVDVLIGRAGRAVAAGALALLGGTYGRRVVVVAGKGNNGADGRAAAAVLARRGVKVTVLDAATLAGGERLPTADLVIDAAYGTGFRGSYHPPDPGGAAVLAVDIPSGLAGDTGTPGRDDGETAAGAVTGAGDVALRAATTVTFAAYKPGLLLGEGPARAGAVTVADIGLGPGVEERCTSWLVEDADVARWVPPRPRGAHKWQSAALVVAGSPGMMGAPSLVSRAAMRAGAGYVRLGVPGATLVSLPSGEAVGTPLPQDWADAAVAEAERCRVMVIGPGLGRGPATDVAVGRALEAAPLPVVVDADGLNALTGAQLASIAGRRSHPTVVTPHDGEYTRLAGQPPGPDRLADVRRLAATTGAIVLLKGPTTVVAHPDGRALLAAAGSARLATAGTGDVLSGVIGAFVARGVEPFHATALAAHVHGRAARLGLAEGLVAGDLPELVARWLSGERP
ncbi:MAG TPA: NAD(P)H-hydrate dehydratase [Acidimicrobiales bacterium]|nr:NAD(P)H-hydrate dehydratase [Acidimicrobiales bacterium]